MTGGVHDVDSVISHGNTTFEPHEVVDAIGKIRGWVAKKERNLIEECVRG